MYAVVTISHPDETLFHSLVQPSNFLDPLPQFIILLNVSSMPPEQVLCALMFEVRPTSKSPPSTKATAASKRKDRLYRVYRVYRERRL